MFLRNAPKNHKKKEIHVIGGAIVFRLIWPSSWAFWLISECLLLLFPALSYPAEITFSWIPAMDVNVAGYRVYYGPPGQDSEFQADAGKETKITLNNLQEGASYSFVVNTYDTTGRESRYSYKTTVLSLKDRDTHFFPSSLPAHQVLPALPALSFRKNLFPMPRLDVSSPSCPRRNPSALWVERESCRFQPN